MNALTQILTTLALVGGALWAYEQLRERPDHGAPDELEAPGLEGRLDGLEERLRSIEDRVAATEGPAEAGAIAAPERTGPLDDAELARLEAVVREIQRRDEIDRLTLSVQTRLGGLGLGLTKDEQAQAQTLLVALEAERADFWRQVRQEGVRDAAAIAERFAPIRERHERSLRGALPSEKARALIQAFLGK